MISSIPWDVLVSAFSSESDPSSVDESIDGMQQLDNAPQFESTDTLKAARILKFVTILKLLRNVFFFCAIWMVLNRPEVLTNSAESHFENVYKGDEIGQGTSQLGRGKFDYLSPLLTLCKMKYFSC